MLPDPDPVAAAPAATPAEERFYLPPPTWFGKHVGPWLVYLPVSGLLGWAWFEGPHSTVAHIGFFVGEVLLAIILSMVLTDKSVTCFTIGPDYVQLDEVGRIKTLLFSEIKGFREHTYKGSTSTIIEPLDPKLANWRIGDYYVDYQTLRRHLAQHVTDFDAVERERHRRAVAAATEMLLQNSTLGPTPHVRKKVLKRATSATRWLTLVAVFLTAWVVFYAVPFELVMALNLAVPLLAVGLLWVYRGAAGFVNDADDPRAGVTFAIAGPSLALAFRNSFDFAFLSWATLGPAALAAGLVFLLALLSGTWPTLRQAKHPLLVGGIALVVAVAYGLSVAVVYNSAFGGTAGTTHVAQVLDKNKYFNKNINYYFSVTSWGPPGTPTYFKVSKPLYDRKKVGDTLTVHLHQGRLGATWFETAEE